MNCDYHSVSPIMPDYSDTYLAFMGLAPKRIPHWEHWSCPDAETYITGIDYYQHPQSCRLKLLEMYPRLKDCVSLPKDDTPKSRPYLGSDGQSSDPTKHTVRWGDSETVSWDWGEEFHSVEQVLAYRPLEHVHKTIQGDLSSEEVIYRERRKLLPVEWEDQAPPGSIRMDTYMHHTMFMWPLQVFGYQKFLEACLYPEFSRIMDEFAELSRRVFKALAQMPINFVLCHDDIVNTRGPVCSPQWMRQFIFPRYEEFFSIVKAAGREVLFMADGCMDAFADDVFACGVRGIITEPYTDFKTIARKHENCFLAGEGDNRILMRNDPQEIHAMVKRMVDTARMTGGYVMCIGNHIPWDTPPQAVKLYLDFSEELANR